MFSVHVIHKNCFNVIDKGALKKISTYLLKTLGGHILTAIVLRNDIKMHLQESDRMGNPLQHHQFVCATDHVYYEIFECIYI